MAVGITSWDATPDPAVAGSSETILVNFLNTSSSSVSFNVTASWYIIDELSGGSKVWGIYSETKRFTLSGNGSGVGSFTRTMPSGVCTHYPEYTGRLHVAISVEPAYCVSGNSCNADLTVSFRDVKPKGQVTINSTPTGASIWLLPGNQNLGTTNKTISFDEGTYSLALTKSGYYDDNFSVSVKWGESKTISRTLTAIKPNVTFTSTPSGADVYVSSTKQGTTPFTKAYDPGSYTFIFKKAGYNDYSVSKTLQSGVDTSVDVTLTPNPPECDVTAVGVDPTPIIPGQEFQVRLTLKNTGETGDLRGKTIVYNSTKSRTLYSESVDKDGVNGDSSVYTYVHYTLPSDYNEGTVVIRGEGYADR
jgi:hypothetical protein